MADSQKIIVESPLSGDFKKNYRFVLWCCRALWKLNGDNAIASHMLCPWFMDDTIEEERNAGIGWSWVWEKNVPHMFFVDFGMSRGMEYALDACHKKGIEVSKNKLETLSPKMWKQFQNGEWPPHTPGFSLDD